MRYLCIGYNDWLSLRKWGQSVKVRNLPYPFLRGQPLKCVSLSLSILYVYCFKFYLFTSTISFQACLKYNPKSISCKYWKGVSYAASGNFYEAVKSSAKVCASDNCIFNLKVILKGALRGHSILSCFRVKQNYLWIEGNLKIVVYQDRKTPKG